VVEQVLTCQGREPVVVAVEVGRGQGDELAVTGADGCGGRQVEELGAAAVEQRRGDEHERVGRRGGAGPDGRGRSGVAAHQPADQVVVIGGHGTRFAGGAGGRLTPG
jgi:hypothetical protein